MSSILSITVHVFRVPPLFICSQIITPFYDSMISTNKETGLWFGPTVESVYPYSSSILEFFYTNIRPAFILFGCQIKMAMLFRAIVLGWRLPLGQLPMVSDAWWFEASPLWGNTRPAFWLHNNLCEFKTLEHKFKR